MSLCESKLKFAFVDNWDNIFITPSRMRLYSKIVPTKEAVRQFVDRVTRQVNEHDRQEKEAEDV